MEIVEQLCIKPFFVEALNGDKWAAEQGRFYTTTIPNDSDDYITVFSNYWVRVPKAYFVQKEPSRMTQAKLEGGGG